MGRAVMSDVVVPHFPDLGVLREELGVGREVNHFGLGF
jgi:hypothetical protein